MTIARYNKAIAAASAAATVVASAVGWAISAGLDLADPKVWLTIALYVVVPSAAVAIAPANRKPQIKPAPVDEPTLDISLAPAAQTTDEVGADQRGAIPQADPEPLPEPAEEPVLTGLAVRNRAGLLVPAPVVEETTTQGRHHVKGEVVEGPSPEEGFPEALEAAEGDSLEEILPETLVVTDPPVHEDVEFAPSFSDDPTQEG